MGNLKLKYNHKLCSKCDQVVFSLWIITLPVLATVSRVNAKGYLQYLTFWLGEREFIRGEGYYFNGRGVGAEVVLMEKLSHRQASWYS